MRIAVDAMGGDHGPGVVVRGSLAAARHAGVALTLVGDQSSIQSALSAESATDLEVTVVSTSDVIGMDEHPAQAVRRRPQASVNLAMNEVKTGRAAGMVSAGNSGAVMASALLSLGRIPSVDRPAIASQIPTPTGSFILLDLGAVTDPKPSNLLQFALMAVIYAQLVSGVKHPRVGLLSNGEEPTKGNHLVQEAFPLLAAEPRLRFVGNIEGKDLLTDHADIVVTDGFTGNVALKTLEGTASILAALIREEVTRGWSRRAAALVLKPAFAAVSERMDYQRFGGAPLLGVNGVAVIAHGRSTERAIANAVHVAARTAATGIIPAIAQMFEAQAVAAAETGMSARD